MKKPQTRWPSLNGNGVAGRLIDADGFAALQGAIGFDIGVQDRNAIAAYVFRARDTTDVPPILSFDMKKRLRAVRHGAKVIADALSPGGESIDVALMLELRAGLRELGTPEDRDADAWLKKRHGLAAAVRQIGHAAELREKSRTPTARLGRREEREHFKQLIRDVSPIYQRLVGKPLRAGYDGMKGQRTGPGVRFVRELSRWVYDRPLPSSTIGPLINAALAAYADNSPREGTIKA